MLFPYVILDTDTVYDDNGIPVSVTRGKQVLVNQVRDDGWYDILMNYDGGPERFGVPAEHTKNFRWQENVVV